MFRCFAPEAKRVTLIGDFNGWDPNAHPLHRQPDGGWLLELPMHHGHHRYMFWVDGNGMLDPNANGVGRTENNERVSLVSVS